MAEHYLANPASLRIVTGMQARSDTTKRYELLRDFGVAEDTAGERLSALLEAKLRAAGVRIPRSVGS